MVNSYAKVFKSTYGFEFVDARLADIVRDMENTAFLIGLGRSTYRRYVRLAQRLFNKPAVMKFVLEESRIAGDSGGKNRSHIGYFTDKTLQDSNEEDMLLMLRCAEAFYSPETRKKFHAGPFFQYCAEFIGITRGYFDRLNSIPVSTDVQEIYPGTYHMFMKCLIQTSRTARITPKQFIINNMATFRYSDDDHGRATWRQLRATITRMKKKLDERYTHKALLSEKHQGGAQPAR